jgi:uncharacterized phage protein (TIGR01671 family)
MKEIKFRAWLISEKRWLGPDDRISIFEEKDFWYSWIYGVSPKGTIELLQDMGIELNMYTTLNDKNNKEIYEQDVVRAPDIFGEKDLINYFIKWNDNYARFCTWRHMLGCGQFLYSFSNKLMLGIDKNKDELDTSTIEVIGNMKENPALLKEN